jgi:hypothetical protein
MDVRRRSAWARRLALLVAVLALAGMSAPSVHAAAHRFWQRSAMTGAQFESFNRTYQEDGFRLVSMSMFGDPIRFTAVWIDTDGPEQLLKVRASAREDGLTLAQVLEFHDVQDLRGYEPDLVGATGSGNAVRYALVMVKTNLDSVWHYRGLNQRQLDTLTEDAMDEQGPKYILHSMAIYGTAAAPTYSPIFRRNTAELGWRLTRNQTYAQYASTFDDYKREGLYPDLTFVSDHVRYSTVWQHFRGIGTWVGTHDLRLNEVQAVFNQWVGRGLGPRHFQCGGFGAATRCIQLFVTNRYPLERL